MRTLLGAARVVGIAVSIAIGLMLILVATVVGDCGFAAGRCPRNSPPVLQDDAFGTAAFGAALLVGVPVFLRKPSWRRLGIAAAAAVAAGVAVGFLVRWNVNS